MEFFDRHKALIITILLFLVTILALYNIHIYNNNNEFQEMLVQLQDFPTEKAPEEKETPPRTKPKPSTSIKTHRAYNVNEEEVEEKFKSRLNEIFEKNSARQEASGEVENLTEGEMGLNQNREEKTTKKSDGNNTTDKVSANIGSLRNSSISFSLLGREAIDIPNPIYTCDTPGRIVVNIKVDALGRVTETSINEASSSSTNECLINQALKYASGAVFTKLAGRNSQPGTITYNFQD